MQTIRKQDISNELAKEVGLTTDQAGKVTEVFFNLMRHSLLQGNQICVRGFATIKPVKRKAKVARNIHKNERMVLPPSTTVKLVPAKSFVKQINAKSYQNIF